ncbi:MAG: SDR family NAD(P)-dependent oxidoreductase, partial [Clostridiales bacterium]|nr:SDR family NAD(P)-dependent oxidoreductase [Candidatus Equinaster intestinalis]
NMNIAVITGASSGLGTEYAKATDKYFEGIDEIWLIARRKERLEKLADTIMLPCRIIDIDITDDNSLNHYKEMLEIYEARVRLLINNAGFGKLGDFEKISREDNAGMVRLNCEAVTVITSITLPFMKSGAQIINVSSIASFVPNTRMAVYCSTKAYITSFSRALRGELKERRINVLAVCPGPMDTEFLPVANIYKGASKTFDMLPRVNPERVARKSLEASKKHRAVYTDRAFYKFYRFLSKIIPHGIMMKLAGA